MHIKLLKNERIKGLRNYREELDKYEIRRLGVYESLISSFIRTYPTIYFDLFERTE